MSSRGSFARNGHVTTEEYSTSEILPSGAEVLEGKSLAHGLPDYSHSANAVYIKKNKDGSFREMRIYDNNGFPIIEIAHMSESSLSNGNREQTVWHYHLYGPRLQRGSPQLMNESIYQKYKNYLEEIGYDKRQH